MSSLMTIPEIQAIDGPADLIRIPNQIDIPTTPRVRSLIDTAEFRRLARISQLGLVSCVYPAANHDRFEHSLGVYRNALLFLKQLAYRKRFVEVISIHDAQVLIIAALAHDIGHWPFCHPIEDMNLEGMARHEDAATAWLQSDAISKCLHDDWQVSPDEVLAILGKDKSTPARSILSSILSGPIDVDKMDYLYRDSLHAGVPYGQNVDTARLIRSLCLNEQGDKLAITHKGRTAAELMVISRYTMFSEVYWHHAVRSATSMFQRAFFEWHQSHRHDDDFSQQLDRLFRSDERSMIQQMQESKLSKLGADLLEQLFGPVRRLHKRVCNYSCLENPELYRVLAHRSYANLVDCGNRLGQLIGQQLDETVATGQILIDAPPVGLEVQFDIEVYYENADRYRSLGEVSPLVNTLARRQFDDHVKQVRVFAEPELAGRMKQAGLGGTAIDRLLAESASK